MKAVRLAKDALKEAFPAIWLEWHFLRRPRSAEVELGYLDRIVPKGAVTVDVGANLGLYTRQLARCSRKVHAFEPARQMADLLRRTLEQQGLRRRPPLHGPPQPTPSDHDAQLRRPRLVCRYRR